MAYKRNEIEDLEELVLNRKKKFVRYQEGAKLYSLGIHAFMDLAKNAGAIYRVKRTVLVNTDIIDEYLETFREEPV